MLFEYKFMYIFILINYSGMSYKVMFSQVLELDTPQVVPI